MLFLCLNLITFATLLIVIGAYTLMKVWDPEKIVVIPDHYIFTADKRANRNVDIMREHCREQNIKYFYDITDLGDFRVWWF